MILRNQSGIDIKYNRHSLSNYKRIMPGDFVVHLRSFQGGFAYSNIEGIASPAYTIFSFLHPKLFDDYFWKEKFSSYNFIQLLKKVTYGVRDGRSISYTDFLTLNEKYPSLSEQSKIGRILKTLNKLLSLQQRKLDQLKRLKRAMLEQIFSIDKINTVPNISFQRNKYGWKKSELGDSVKIYRGVTYHPSDVLINHGSRILRSSNILNGNVVAHENDIFVSSKVTNNYLPLKAGDILITAANGSSKLVGKHGLVPERLSYSYAGGFMLFIRTDNSQFFNALMSSVWYKKLIHNSLTGGNGSIGNLKMDTLLRAKVFLPSNSEMVIIGNLFKKLNKQISLQITKTKQLKTIKKYLLQKLFI